jgi:pimeloyl-ACP methyl ester carboxylesterase
LSPQRAYAQLFEISTQPLTAADGSLFEVTTAFVRVPELRSRDDKASGDIDLAVVRVHRAGAPASANAHIVLAGGPGDSGVNLVTTLARQGGAALWDLFDSDVVGIDQRGTGRSRPNLAVPALYNLPLDTPGSPKEWLPRIERVCREAAASFRSRGIRLEAYNTRESADDVDAVRRAFGYHKLTLWGRSYGSHLALATVAQHEGIVERVILVSPEGPDHTWKLPSQVDHVIHRLTERGAPDLEGNIRRVLSQLATEPATVAVRDPVTGAQSTIRLGPFDVQWVTAQALGDPRLLATLPAAFREMAQGRFERVGQVLAMHRSRAGVQSAMKHMMDLSSGASPERRQRIEREAPHALLGNAINFPGMFLTDAWTPVIDLGDTYRRPVRSSVPALILVGDLDPRTPVSNAREIAATLPAATLLIIENATHQFDVFGSPVVRGALAHFLRGQSIADATLTLPPIAFQK